MPKNIKWTPKQKQTLSNAVRKYNTKLTKLGKSNPELKPFLPDKKSVADLKSSIVSANDLQKEVRAINRLFREGALEPITTAKGVKTTKYELAEIKRKVRAINERRAQELKEMPEDAAYKGVIGAIERNQQSPKVFNPDMLTEAGWKKFVAAVEFQARPDYKQIKYNRYKENYIKAVINNYGMLAHETGYVKFLQRVPAEYLSKGYFADNRLDIQFHYTFIEQYERMMVTWKSWNDFLYQEYLKEGQPGESQWMFENRNVEERSNYMPTSEGYVDIRTGEFFSWEDEEEEDE